MLLLKDAIMEYELECKVRRLAQGTIDNYDRHLRYMRRYLEDECGITRLEDVKPAHLKRFLLEKEDLGRKPQYINDLLKVFKTFFRYCVEEEYLKTSPAAKVKNVRQPKVLIRTFNEEEVLRMLNYHNGHDFISMRNKAMLALFFDTGMRLTEVMTMKDEQIRDGHVVVWGKGSKERVVPCSPYLARMLMKYRVARDTYFEMKNTTPQAYFFLSYRGKAMTQESVSKLMKRTAAAVNVRKDIRVSPHTCRHTFAHLQLKNGLDIYSLSRLLGHENIGITQKYLNGIRDDEVLVAARQTGVLRNL